MHHGEGEDGDGGVDDGDDQQVPVVRRALLHSEQDRGKREIIVHTKHKEKRERVGLGGEGGGEGGRERKREGERERERERKKDHCSY